MNGRICRGWWRRKKSWLRKLRNPPHEKGKNVCNYAFTGKQNPKKNSQKSIKIYPNLDSRDFHLKIERFFRNLWIFKCIQTTGESEENYCLNGKWHLGFINKHFHLSYNLLSLLLIVERTETVWVCRGWL